MNLLRIFAVLAATLLAGCQVTQTVDHWTTSTTISHKPEKVAVLAVLPDELMRKAVEIDAAKVLAQKGTPAVPSSNLKGMSGGIRGEIDVEQATALLRANNVDGIIVMFYSGGGVAEEYVRSDYWLQHVGSGMGYSWGRPYFTNVYTVRQGPGFADTRTVAYVESSYYDIETEEPIWRLVTKTKDVEHTDGVVDIAKKMASEMRKSGLN